MIGIWSSFNKLRNQQIETVDPPINTIELYTQDNSASIVNEVDAVTGWSGNGAWRWSVDVDGLVSTDADGTDPYHGTHSIQIKAASDGAWKRAFFTFDVDVGDEITFSIWAKRGAQGTEQAFHTSGFSDNSAVFVTTTDWTEYTFTRTATSSTTAQLLANATYNTGLKNDSFYIDHISITKPGTSVADTQAPTIPTNLTASNPSFNSVDLSWTASTDDTAVTGYKIYVDDSLNTTLGNVTSTTISGLTADTSYNFTVSAIDAVPNESGQSSIASASTLTNQVAASEVTLVSAVSNSKGDEITLTFSDVVNGNLTGLILQPTNTVLTTATGFGTNTLVVDTPIDMKYGRPYSLTYKSIETLDNVIGGLTDASGTFLRYFLKEWVDISAVPFSGDNKYVTVTGGGLHDGSSEANAYTISEMNSNVTSDYVSASAHGLRYNIKAGSYGSTTPVFDNVDGSNLKPIILEGYTTAIGDNPSINWSTSYTPNGAIMPWFDAPDSGNGILIYNGSSYITLKNIEVSGFDNSVYFNNVNYTWIDNVYVHESGDKAIQMVGISTGNVVSNSISFRGNTFNFSTNGAHNLFINNESYCDVNPYVTDYYFSLKGKHHVFRNNKSHRIGNNSHNGHALSIQTDAPNNNNVDTQETWYNFVDGLESINIVKATELRHGGVRYNVVRNVYSHPVIDGGENQTGGVLIRDNASENIVENCWLDLGDSLDGSGITFNESVEIGVGLGHDNIVRNNVILNSLRGIYARSYNNTITPDWSGNKIYNNTFYNIVDLFRLQHETGMDFTITTANEFKNNIFSNVDNYYLTGSNYYAPTDFPNKFTFDTNNFNQTVTFTSVGTNVNTDSPLFVNTGSDFRLQASSTLKDIGLTLLDVLFDKDGIGRPQGTGYSLGAYEFFQP